MNLEPVSNVIEMTSNDTLPSFVGSVLNDDGTPVDLTGITITLHINYPTPLVKTAVLLDGGRFHFGWLHGDLRVGRWEVEIQFSSATGVQTFHRTAEGEKILFKIREEIA